ncbi:MAG: hypothetical protein CVV13_11155 [Gammaproteobacteria bacterium HGW-Gammaproteobacteria-3]|nr:MAG: hypothetical protein CVV13_11155 [Gammaproteobacteria bacterium HGW-Gammaproteobacteria-3]
MGEFLVAGKIDVLLTDDRAVVRTGYKTRVKPEGSDSIGLFHPIKPHRINRVLRGHLVLMEFLLHATLSYKKPTMIYNHCPTVFRSLVDLIRCFIA